MTDKNELVEIQGTGEESTFKREELNDLLDLAELGIKELINIQKKALKDIGKLIGEVEGE